MRISIVGTGYVGLVTGVGFAVLGNEVTCFDVDEKKVRQINEGVSPIFESGLQELLGDVVRKRRLCASSKPESLKHQDLIFIAVGIPSRRDGRWMTLFCCLAAKSVGKELSGDYPVVVVKSTVVL